MLIKLNFHPHPDTFFTFALSYLTLLMHMQLNLPSSLKTRPEKKDLHATGDELIQFKLFLIRHYLMLLICNSFKTSLSHSTTFDEFLDPSTLYHSLSVKGLNTFLTCK